MVNFSTKIASTISVAALLATTLSTSVVSAASEFLAYAELLADNDVIGTQSTEAGYRLGDTVTRAELAKVAANLGGYTPTDCVGTFTDVTSDLGDLCGYIEALGEAGVVASVNYFRPTASVTRAEMVKMLVGVVGEEGSSADAGYMDIAGLGDLAMYINRANELGCAADAAYFRPNATASRGEAFKIAACVAGLEPITVDPVDPVPGTGTGVVTGAVTASLDGSAMAQYVPQNASSVKVGTVKLTAGASDVVVSSIVITRSGLGNVSEISSAQLAQGGVTVSDSRTFSTSSQTSTLKLNSNTTIKAGTSASFDVLVSLNGGANNQHQFAVTAVNAVSATVTGLPVTLGLLNTTSYSVGQLSNVSITAGSLTSGKTNQLLATVKMTPNRDAIVNGFTVSKGTGEDFNKIVTNAKAYFNGVVVGTVVVGTDKITVTGLNVARLSGEEAAIEIRGDGIYVGQAANTTFKINETTDLSATEKTTGYVFAVTGTFPTSTVTLSLSQVDIVMTKVSTGSKTVAPGTSSVELYNANITSDATFDVSIHSLSVTGGSLTNFVDDKVTAYINGVDYEITSTGIATASGKVFSSTSDRFRIEPGVTVNVRVVGSVRSTASTGSTYKFTFGLWEAKNVSNGQTVNLSRTLDGDTITISNGTYTIEKSSTTPTNKTVMEGSQSDLLYINLRPSAEDQTLKSLKVTSSGVFSTYATKVALMKGNSEIKSFTDTNSLSGTSVIFDSLTESLTKDVATAFTVRVTLKSGEVTTLGQSLKLTVAAPATDVSVVRSANTSVPTSTSSAVVNGNTYQVSSNTPSVALPTQVGKLTHIVFSNPSNYDVQVNSVKYEMTRNVATNGSYVQWSGTSLFLDGENGSNVGTVVGAIPGTVTVTFAPTDLLVSGSPVDRVIELVDPANSVLDDQYNVTVKEISYIYKDRTTGSGSAVITESYTVTK